MTEAKSMILIAESGSTKTAWRITDGDENTGFETAGLNPFFVDAGEVCSVIDTAWPKGLSRDVVREVHFYGAGCMGPKAKVIEVAMRDAFPKAAVHTYVDLLAAARALLGSQPGFVAILGTGTNSCLYDGEKISHHIDSLGYILGDEGSGTAIGRRLLSDFLRGAMPDDVHRAFDETYQLNSAEVLHRVYSEPAANAYCAGFTRFISEDRLQNAYFRTMLQECFDDFFRSLVSRYPGYREHAFNCVGSVAHAFRYVLAEVAVKWGMRMGRIVASPIEALTAFHRNIYSPTIL